MCVHFKTWGTLKVLPFREYYSGDWKKVCFAYDGLGVAWDIAYSESRHEYRCVDGVVDYK